jgi:poly(3-hydroxybutyrate) depolymerase
MLSKALIYLPLFVSLAVSKVLPPGQSPGKTSFATIKSSGVLRTYNISIPPNYDGVTPTPLIFSFHGGTSNPTEQEILSQMSNPEFNDFAIAVYPAGINVRPPNFFIARTSHADKFNRQHGT